MQPSSPLRLPVLPALTALLVAFTAAACGDRADSASTPPPAEAARPELRTKADSVAMVLYDSLGGPAWASVPYLRFNFGFEREGAAQVARRHLWNRQTGDYRVEWKRGEDSSYVALFNVGTQDGQVFLNGAPVDTTQQEELLAGAYRGYINDTYWLLAPLKVFDPGVTRTYAADSSGDGHDVIQLSFQEVGLTPGDRYWFYVDQETGRMDQWAMVLQNMDSTAAPRVNRWEAYERFDTPNGPVLISTRKPNPDGTSALVTDAVEMPSEVPAEMWTDPQPRLE